MTRTLTKLALAAALALGVAGCVYEPAPYYGYYGPAYAGPSVSLNYRSGGGWYRPHGRD